MTISGYSMIIDLVVYGYPFFVYECGYLGQVESIHGDITRYIWNNTGSVWLTIVLPFLFRYEINPISTIPMML